MSLPCLWHLVPHSFSHAADVNLKTRTLFYFSKEVQLCKMSVSPSTKCGSLTVFHNSSWCKSSIFGYRSGFIRTLRTSRRFLWSNSYFKRLCGLGGPTVCAFWFKICPTILQVSVLTDQVEVQGEKIRDLDTCLEHHREKLNATEELLQQVRRLQRRLASLQIKKTLLPNCDLCI